MNFFLLSVFVERIVPYFTWKLENEKRAN